MSSQTQDTAPKILSFHAWTVANYHTGREGPSDCSIDDDNIDEKLERDILGYKSYLSENGTQAKMNQFHELYTNIRGRPYQLAPPTQELQDRVANLSTEQPSLCGPISFSRYEEIKTLAYSQTWTASMAHREAHAEADRRELYGLPRNWDTINGADERDPRTIRIILESVIAKAERECSEVVRVEVLDMCRPHRRVLRAAVATESQLTEAQINFIDPVVCGASRIMDQYQLDLRPAEPDQPLKEWEWMVLASEAERDWQEEHDRNVTQQEWLEELRVRLAQRIEEDDKLDEELEDENGRIRTFGHKVWGNLIDHYYVSHSSRSGIELDQFGDPIVANEVEDNDDHHRLDADDSDDDSSLGDFCDEVTSDCGCDLY
ncbi:hypothetical protein ONS95_000741 [Cadophora gregata]|uniref:uncharacterized protein n=1 Tax=Cadophora gregata TaxID=51156 RepID=UPI0026DAD384|nr:uncharacterized protein ONS95_000741 [Cadophora gregata]KAK0103080.1 hypothetical protein ONS96_005691 [Cadophora gregata f. sp. sojae]KAK0128791.1 hypothetical protein ONS95_000741 [Cadophora gregata]